MRAQGFTTTPTGKKWSPMAARVSGGAAGSPKVKVKTDAVDDWPIIGFGGSVPEMPGWTMGNLSLSEEQRQPFFDMYFGDDGARYNFLRLCIHTTFDDYTFADVPGDFNLEHFDYNVTGDRENYKFQTVKKVQEMVPDLTIIGSAWSPPSWMKLGNHSMNGSPNPCLKRDPRYHEVWAKYLVTWVDAYERLGVPIWAITQQNEPQNYFTQNWATCVFEPEAQLAFIRDHLGPAMKAANKSTKLFFNDDDKNFLPDVAKLILEDEVAAGYVHGAGIHWYLHDQYQALQEYKEKYLSKYSLMTTEAATTIEPDFNTPWERALRFPHSVIVDFVHGGSRAFVDYSMLGGAGGNENVYVLDNGTFGARETYYTFGQVTRYMKKGSYVLSSVEVPNPGKAPDGVHPAGLEAMATINPERTEVVILVVRDEESEATDSTFEIDVQLGNGQHVTVTLDDVENRSVSTVVVTGKF
ncbi:hypothetical protein FOZ60_004736 [Perkinsus olseni]|uniref:Glycosyl hydrolase family 30 TIM-barrel domain-containing protein n=2 Tax=Perkinsus olseni TaxID=32597 RepID=A0A7J6NSI4_PEROL|nr:hypothetical protein FOZ60_004736 [Perkinsus olseni]